MKQIVFSIGLFLIGLNVGWSQNTVTGTVTDEEGETLIGVNIFAPEQNTGTVTDLDGTYSINVPADGKLQFSLVGYSPEDVDVNGRSVINVTMKEGVALDEVVVTALGISREKKALGYSVTEVSGDEVSTVKETNVVNSLAGKVSGVVITQSAAGPGSGSRVIIRGNNSLTGNNQPLYVVDGVPIDNSGFGSAAGGGTGEYARTDYGTGVSDINPDDIASISVLKGPNAAALYGSRAANGVILITTKKGSAQKGIGVTYSTNYTFSNPLLLPQYQNQYGQGTQGDITDDFESLKTIGASWGAPLDGSSQLYYTGEQRPYTAQPDNVKDFFRTGSNWVNTLALEGGTSDMNMRFSYTNTDANSILPNSGIDRNNFNLRGFANLSDKLTLDARITYFTQKAKNRVTQGTEGIMAYVYDIPRNLRLEDYKDYQNESDLSVRTYSSSNGNPYWILYNDKNEDQRNRFQGFAKATYQFNDWLSGFARIGTDYVNQDIQSVSAYGHWFYSTGRFNYSTHNTTETNSDFLLMANKRFSDNLALNANFGGNLLLSTAESQSVFGEDFKIPTKATTSSARTLQPGYTPQSKKKVHSLYASASLSWQNMIYLDFSGRNDWSSTLPADNRSYFYPSVSLSYLLNESLNMRNVDLAKLRISWAQVGSDTGPYQLQNFYNLQQDSYLDRTTLTRPGVRLNPDLKPEQTKSLEFGTELRFLQNRVYTDISYYSISSENLIMDVPVPASTGYSTFRTNVGKITNKGFEVLLGGVPVSGPDFNWDVSLNFSHNQNELVELVEELENFTFSTTNSGTARVQATVGGGFGDIYGRTWRRTDDGRIIVDATGRPQASDNLVHLGNYQPDWVGGLSNTLNYKDFSLRFLIDFRFGGQLYSGTDAALDGSGVSKKSLKYRDGGVLVDGVVNTGTADAPVYEANTNQISAQQYWGAVSGIASEYIYDQDNMRLREISLMYKIPAAILGDSFIKGLNVGLVGRNLFFLFKDSPSFDPESSYSTSNFSQGFLFYNLPSTRQLGVNLSVKF